MEKCSLGEEGLEESVVGRIAHCSCWPEIAFDEEILIEVPSLSAPRREFHWIKNISRTTAAVTELLNVQRKNRQQQEVQRNRKHNHDTFFDARMLSPQWKSKKTNIFSLPSGRRITKQLTLVTPGLSSGEEQESLNVVSWCCVVHWTVCNSLLALGHVGSDLLVHPSNSSQWPASSLGFEECLSSWIFSVKRTFWWAVSKKLTKLDFDFLLHLWVRYSYMENSYLQFYKWLWVLVTCFFYIFLIVSNFW